MNEIGRRQFLIAAGALAAAPLVLAQQDRRRLAWFGTGRSGVPSPYFDAFKAGLRDLGWEDGRNLVLTPFWADGTRENSEFLVRQMFATKPEVIVAFGRDVFALHAAKPAVPVVFAFSGDPVDAGFVQSFARPGGNFTGISFMSLDLAGKRIELLREIVPQVRRLAVLARPEHPGEHRERAVSEEVARRLGIEMIYVPMEAASGLDGALQAIARRQCDSLVAFPDAVMLANSGRIAKFATEAKIATVSGWGSFADDGFLLAYGPNLHSSYRGLARYVDRILRGAKPDELPVELPRTVEFVLNARTARALGLAIPASIIQRADRVVE